jgi:putative FmdB family regulatory protein
MPIYVYKCEYCDIKVEENKRYDAADDAPYCQKCDTRMIRDYRFAAIQFKGPGFYTTDE